MARTTDVLVKELISLTTLTTTEPFILVANVLVTEHLTTLGMSTVLLAEIERYLAAHLTALHNDERQFLEQKLGDATDTYAGTFGKGLDLTQWGQSVKMLDSSGVLASLGTGEYVSFNVLDVDYDATYDC